jgi:hypothetical protein
MSKTLIPPSSSVPPFLLFNPVVFALRHLDLPHGLGSTYCASTSLRRETGEHTWPPHTGWPVCSSPVAARAVLS